MVPVTRGANDADGRRQEMVMANGTVKFFNDSKGFGFIRPDDGSRTFHAYQRCRAGWHDNAERRTANIV